MILKSSHNYLKLLENVSIWCSETINQLYTVPFFLKIFFEILSIGSNKPIIQQSKRPGEKLCDALEGMGTTFIKLGQFLATRPDIIGNQLANKRS